jgi:hypothetical protein
MNNYFVRIVLMSGDEVHSRVSNCKNQEEAIRRIHNTKQYQDFIKDGAIKYIDIEIDKSPRIKNDFRIYNDEGVTLIEHLSYPRFIGEITFGEKSDIENVDMIDDDASAVDMATAMRMAEDYMFEHQKK